MYGPDFRKTDGDDGFIAAPRNLDELVDLLDIRNIRGEGSVIGLGLNTDINHDIQHFTTFGPETKWPI
jgi:hypothetical protein